MITRENFKHVMSMIPNEELRECLEKDEDYITVELAAFNAGAVATVASVDYDEEHEEAVMALGNIYMDKDSFYELCRSNKVAVYEEETA